MGGETVRTPDGRGTRGEWRVRTEEYPLGRADGLGGVAIAIRQDGVPPEHFHAWWKRLEDGFQVEMEIEMEGAKPVVREFTVRPPDGVRTPADTHPPIREMAKQAARGHGVELPFVQEWHLTDEGRKDERYRIAVEAGDEAKANRVPMVPYVQAQLRKAGFTEGLSESRIQHLRTEAKKLGYMDKDESK